jgi:hypothetical protein
MMITETPTAIEERSDRWDTALGGVCVSTCDHDLAGRLAP